MSWFRLSLGAADLAVPALDEVRRAVDTQWRAAGCPPDLAAFSRHESEGRLHCELIVYFSPAAAAVAQALGARPGSRPGPHGLAHLAGGDRAPLPTD